MPLSKEVIVALLLHVPFAQKWHNEILGPRHTWKSGPIYLQPLTKALSGHCPFDIQASHG